MTKPSKASASSLLRNSAGEQRGQTPAARREGANGPAAGRLGPDVALEAIPAMPKDALLALGRAAILTLGDLRRHALKGGWRTLETALGTVRGMTMKWANTAAAAIRDAGGELAEVQAPAPAAKTPPADAGPGAPGSLQSAPEPDELIFIAPKSIRPNPLNPRKHFDQAELEELAASIRSKGVIEPIILRPHPDGGAAGGANLQLVIGERRVRAAALAGVQRVPAIVRRLDDTACLEMMIVENEQRKDVSALEKAAGYKALLESSGMTMQKLAGKVGKSESTIRNLLRLRDLPEVARKALEAGTLSPATASLIARVPGEPLRKKLSLHVLAGSTWWQDGSPARHGERGEREPLSYDQTRLLIREHCMVELKGAPFDRGSDKLVPGAGACTDCPKRVGNLQKTEPEEYRGVRADVCTDPDCYAQKVQAEKAVQTQQAKAAGTKVLPDAEARSLFWGESQLSHHCDFLDLDAKCDGDKKGRTYGQVLDAATKGDVLAEELKEDQVLAFDPLGHAHRLLPKSKALPVLAERVKLNGQAAANLKVEREATKRWQEERAQHEAGKAAALQAIGEVVKQALGQFERLYECSRAGEQARLRLRATVRQFVHFARFEPLRIVVKRWEKKTDLKPAEAIDLALEGMGANDLLALLAEIVAAEASLGWGSSYIHEDRGGQFWQAWGIDRDKLMQEAAQSEKPSKKKATAK